MVLEQFAENLDKTAKARQVASLRDAFEDFEEKVKIKIDLANKPVYKEDTHRKKQRCRNDGNSEDTDFSGRDKFRVTVFVPMIDHLLTSLQKRLEAYDAVSVKFGFLSKMISSNGG